VMTDSPKLAWSGSHEYTGNFYILDFKNFATPSYQCIGMINKLVDDQLVDYTYDSRARRG